MVICALAVSFPPSMLQRDFGCLPGVKIRPKMACWNALQVFFLNMPPIFKMKLIRPLKMSFSQDCSVCNA